MTSETFLSETRRGLIALAAVAAAGSVALWRTLKPLVVWLLQALIAVVIIFEEWGWQPLAAALGWLARFRPIAALECRIAALPPYAALFVFAAPVALLFPLKLIAVWLLADGRVFAAGALFIGAKITSTALIARIFMLTKPRLMEIAWFARGYAWFIPWKERAFAWLRSSPAWRWGRIAKVEVKRATWPARLRVVAAAKAFAADVRSRWPAVVAAARAGFARLQREASAAITRIGARLTRMRVL